MSPQSIVPSGFRSVHQLLQDAVTTQADLKILGPNLIVANGEAFKKHKYCSFRQLQNCGNTAVKFLVDNDNDCTEQNFHGILAGGNAVDDGLGSIVDFSKTAQRVTIFGVGGAVPRICTFEGVTQQDTL